MHPAYSVIFFTTASGAGYGLWFWLGLRVFSEGEGGPWSLAALCLGGVLVTLGLFSSTFHLGHPERAWRAFSQWRSSWLSREGVAAVATYVPAAYLFLSMIAPAQLPGISLGGIALAIGSVATVWCTGMIYASLRTVPEWNLGVVPVVYLVLAAGTGALILSALDAIAGVRSWSAVFAALFLLAALILKWRYWSRTDGAPLPFSTEQAIGIPSAARVRPLDPPHTQPNFVMREMGYIVARRHAKRLRMWSALLLFGAPLASLLISTLWSAASPVLLPLAVLSAAIGVWVERWLFFAEARHLSMLYYPSPGQTEAQSG